MSYGARQRKCIHGEYLKIFLIISSKQETGWLLVTPHELEAVRKRYRRPQNGQTPSHGKHKFIQNLDLKRRREKQINWKLVGRWEYNRHTAECAYLALDSIQRQSPVDTVMRMLVALRVENFFSNRVSAYQWHCSVGLELCNFVTFIPEFIRNSDKRYALNEVKWSNDKQ